MSYDKEKKIIGALITFAVLLSTAEFATAKSAETLAKQAEFNRTIPICTNEKDCTDKWDAAQLWVVHHADFKIQTATNVLIETYNATNGTTSLAVRVTKEPVGGGQYKFLVNVWCDNIFGCIPNNRNFDDEWDAALDFNRTVGAAGQSNQSTDPAQTNATGGKLRFGVSLGDVTPTIATMLNRPDLKGAVIGSVSADSIADKAGVKVGDILVAFDGRVITSAKDLQEAVAATQVGKSISLSALRALKEVTLNASF